MHMVYNMFSRSIKLYSILIFWLVRPIRADFVDETVDVLRINGGNTVTEIVPYQVSLQEYRYGRYYHICGGAIISKRHVITAAHCFDNRRMEYVYVVSGTLKWEIGGTRYRIWQHRIHAGYRRYPVPVNDIAIIKVWPGFNFSLPTTAAISYNSLVRLGDGIPVRITGWGLTVPEGNYYNLASDLQELIYYTISNHECSRRRFPVTNNEVCALWAAGKSSCMGDSGGPLVTITQPPLLVGIVSYGEGKCAQGNPDVYTRVSSFLPYINRVITLEIP